MDSGNIEVNVVDAFSGIGGFIIGLKMAGLRITKQYFSEVEPYAIKVYQQRFPGAIPLGDITKVDGKKLDNIDIFTAVFPCQDISIAGKGRGLEGERSGLFGEIIRIAKDCNPRIILLENVARLTSIHEGRDFGKVLGALAEIGYDCIWNCIPASHVGAPHPRDRVWFVAYPNMRRRIHGETGIIATKGRKQAQRISGTGSRDVANTHGQHVERHGEIRFKKSEMGQQNTQVKGRHEIIQEWRDWPIEPNVGRMANGVPSRVDRLECLGNSVVPQVVAFITEKIVIPILR